MVLSIIIFGWFFISFRLFWYCENPSTIYSLASTSVRDDLTDSGSNWINNQTCYSLFSIRTHWAEDAVFITRNVADQCPDIDKEYPNRKQICSSRKVFIFAAIGFLIIKFLGLVMYVYAFLKVYWWWFNVKIKYLKIRWDIMNSLALLVLVIALIFWIIWTGVVTTIGGLQIGPIIDIILIVVYRILSIHAKKYMNDIERYRIMQDL